MRGRAALNQHPIWPCSAWGLQCRLGYPKRGELLPRHFTLTRSREASGGIFSVALSVASPEPTFPDESGEENGIGRPAVNWHAALWSSDVPPRYAPYRCVENQRIGRATKRLPDRLESSLLFLAIGVGVALSLGLWDCFGGPGGGPGGSGGGAGGGRPRGAAPTVNPWLRNRLLLRRLRCGRNFRR